MAREGPPVSDLGVAGTHRAAKNSLIRGVGYLAGAALFFFSVVLTARYLGVADFGDYSFILAVAGLLQLVADMGVRNVLIRDLAVDPESLPRRLGVAQGLLLVLSAISFLGTVLVAVVLPLSSEVRQAMCLAGLAVVATIQALGYSAVLRAFERMDLDILGFVAHKVLLLLLVFGLCYTPWGLRGMLGALLAANTGLYVYYRLLVTHFHGPTRLSLDVRAAYRLLADSFPLGMAELLRRVSWQIDRLLLKAISGSAAVGLFSSAYKFVEAAKPLAQNLTLPLYPLLSRKARTAPAEAFAAYHRGLKVLYVLSAPGALVLGLLSDPIVGLLFGASFRRAGPALALMAPAAVLLLPATLNAYLFTALGRQRTYTLCAGLALLVNASVDVVLIPSHGFMGASVARLASELAFFLFGAVALIRLGAGPATLTLPGRVLLACVGPGLMLLAVRNRGLVLLVVGVGLSLVVYAVMLWILRVVSRADAALALGFLRSLRPGGAQGPDQRT